MEEHPAMLEHGLPVGWMMRRELVEREQRCSNGRQMQELAWGRARSLAVPTVAFGAGELPQVCAKAEGASCIGPRN